MAESSEDTFDHEARAAGLHRALADHREDVRAAARAAEGYRRRRAPLADMALEPAHVCRFDKPGDPG